MPTVEQEFPPKFLRAEDLAGKPPQRVVVREVTREQSWVRGKRIEKWVVWFEGKQRGLPLCGTSARQTEEATGISEMLDWKGQELVLYHDPDEWTSEGNGAIRVRAVAKNREEGQ